MWNVGQWYFCFDEQFFCCKTVPNYFILSFWAVFPLQNGNVAMVTGGIKGIGYHTVKNLARLGMHVIIGIIVVLLSVNCMFLSCLLNPSRNIWLAF